MEKYLILFTALIIIGILMLILGITFRKKWSPTGVACLIIFGASIAIISGALFLTFGFFLR
ncbi:MAG: hypothetical protein PHG58_02020 [Clostridia bacterium]|jgi:uncharacterized membrane-anchored protein|nr:hypothetical protein [Clostridia bacterium]